LDGAFKRPAFVNSTFYDFLSTNPAEFRTAFARLELEQINRANPIPQMTPPELDR
jgi:hypothetical protein